ncbi:MAG: hypothetical protein RIM72_16855 [Alphaproteobacteria bacterium]
MRGGSREDAESAIHYVAPAGQKEEYVDRAIGTVVDYLPAE